MQQKQDPMDRVAMQDMPPRKFMQKIMDKNSKLYCLLWDRKDKEGKISIKWEDLAYLYQKNSFRASMRKLRDQGLLTYTETQVAVKIKLLELEG